jgi:Ca2+-binding RTX toxin-like protein
MNTKNLIPAALLASAALVPLSIPATAHAVAPTCHGQRATIVGTAGADRLVGTPGADVVVALGGDDVVLARGGDDLVCGGDGADTLRGGAGDDRLYGETERLAVDRGGRYLVPDVLAGGPGDDLLDVGGDARGRSADWGDHGTLDFGGASQAVVVDLAAGTATGEGSDTVVAYRAVSHGYGVVVRGSRYDDVLRGSRYGDRLVGGRGDDELAGRGGADELYAEDDSAVRPGRPADTDVLLGGPGPDRLVSQLGDDDLQGGPGRDELVRP